MYEESRFVFVLSGITKGRNNRARARGADRFWSRPGVRQGRRLRLVAFWRPIPSCLSLLFLVATVCKIDLFCLASVTPLAGPPCAARGIRADSYRAALFTPSNGKPWQAPTEALLATLRVARYATACRTGRGGTNRSTLGDHTGVSQADGRQSPAARAPCRPGY